MSYPHPAFPEPYLEQELPPAPRPKEGRCAYHGWHSDWDWTVEWQGDRWHVTGACRKACYCSRIPGPHRCPEPAEDWDDPDHLPLRGPDTLEEAGLEEDGDE